MIVCHRHKFIFIRTRKTAGTSIEIYLSSRVGSDAIITPVSPRDELIRREFGGLAPRNYMESGLQNPVLASPGPGPGVRFYNHIPADQARSRLGEATWSSYFKFCVERNPWDKVVSRYWHRCRTTPRPTLDQFIRSGEAFDCVNFGLYSSHGRPLVDRIIRYEHLPSEFSDICESLGISQGGELPMAKAQFRKRNVPVRISSRSDRMVARGFADEIAQHGYERPDFVVVE